MNILQACGFLAVVVCINASGYSDLLLYLYNLDRMDNKLPLPEYYPEEGAYNDNLDNDWGAAFQDSLIDEASPKVSRGYGEAALRDQEYMKQLPITGYQFISGGTGRQEDSEEVKTDKVLPAYCTPPNPCPTGYTGTDNCLKDFDNTPDNNRRILESQDCACDAEHMLSCPPGKKTIDPKSGFVNTDSIGDIDLSDMDTQDLDSLNLPQSPYLKRQKLVAKKSPHFVQKRATQERFDDEGLSEKLKEQLDFMNPYFSGQPKSVAAKKQAPRRNMK